MRYPPLGPELRELLAGGEEEHAKLRELLENNHPRRAAEILTCLRPDEITTAMSLLEIGVEQEMFEYFEPDLQEKIVLGSSRARIQELLAGLPSDERADFLDTLDEVVRQQLMPLLAREARLDLLRRDSFEDDKVGAIMSTEFCLLGQELTMPRALEEVRQQAPSKETIYYSYVLDRDGKLRGFISLRDLIVADQSLTVGEVMKTELVWVTVNDDQEHAARLIREYDILALPVLDEEQHMVGLITHDDAVDIIDEEFTEDVKMIAGITAVEDEPDDYMASSVLMHFRGRVTWLAFLAVSFLAIALIIEWKGKPILQSGPGTIIAFLPLLLATGANVGGQASALILRALAVHSLDHTALKSVLWKEFRIGLLLCLVLSGIVFGMTGLFAMFEGEPFDAALGFGVSAAVGAHVITAAVVGSMIPLLFSRMDMKPEVFSHPALNFVSDTTGTIIYLVVLFLVLPTPA
jgi:magnesium transporter